MKLYRDQVEDQAVREALRRAEDEFNGLPFKRGDWKHIELTFTAAVTGYLYPHRLGFRPKDVIPTSCIGAGTVTWNYDSFNSETISITTTGPCVVRAIIGTYN